jgi:hypothetical protein
MQLEMIPCPKCGNDFPKLRKEKYGYHVCVNCSTVEAVVGITTVEGTGDHTYNDLIIMDQSRAMAIARKEAELSGRKIFLEVLDFDTDELAVSKSIEEKVDRILNEDLDDEDEFVDEDEEIEGIRGIDY